MKRLSIIAAAFIAALVGVGASGAAIAQETGSWVLIDAEGSALVRSGTEAMYNLRYAEADSIFNILIQRKPDHPAGYFLEALVDWWRIVPNSSVDSKVDAISKSFNSRLDKVIEICDARLEKNGSDIV